MAIPSSLSLSMIKATKSKRPMPCSASVSSDKVDAVIGEVTSSNTPGDDQNRRRQQTPLVSSTATNDRVTRNHPYVSRVCFSDSFRGVVGANLASRDLKAKTAAIVFDSSNDYSVGLGESVPHPVPEKRRHHSHRGPRPRAAARTLKPSWRASRRRMST